MYLRLSFLVSFSTKRNLSKLAITGPHNTSLEHALVPQEGKFSKNDGVVSKGHKSQQKEELADLICNNLRIRIMNNYVLYNNELYNIQLTKIGIEGSPVTERKE